ncbi:MAG: hypothetical protein WC069_05950 [Candidatus Shapirobacteria bacterium]
MSDFNQPQNNTAPTDTSNSLSEGRLKVDTSGMKKKKKAIIKKYLKNK